MHSTFLLSFLLSIVTSVTSRVPLEGSIASDAELQSHRRLDGLNKDGPWPSCLFIQYELCEAYLLKQADDIWISRVSPHQYDYNRVIIYVDDNGITTITPGRG